MVPKSPSRRLILAVAATLAASALAACGEAAAPAVAPDLPARLSETGLYLPGAGLRVDPSCLSYAPRFPLWTDGAAKRRWIRLPAGAAIDGRDPDAWRFPPGTRLWKEFALGTRIETRLLDVGADGRARYATYLWRADGSDADRVDGAGLPAVAESAPGIPYDLPGEADCRACHDAGRGPVLGFSAFQLAPRLADLVAAGLVRGHPVGAVHPLDDERMSSRTRAAHGYLVGNCAHCHNPSGPLRVLDLDLSVPWSKPVDELTARTLSRALRLVPGNPRASPLLRRMTSRAPVDQMPPLGTHRVDADAVELLTAWIRDDLAVPAASPSTPSLEKHP